MSATSVWLCTVGLGTRHGGVAHVARCSLEALSHCRTKRLSRVVSLLDADEVGSLPTVAGAPIHRCGGARLRFLSRVATQVTSPPDLILFDHVDLAQCQVLLPRWRRAPYAVWVHGIEVWRRLSHRKSAALEGAEMLIFNSDFTRRRFESFHGNQHPSTVVPLTLNAEKAQGSDPSAADRKPWLLTVGRLEAHRPKGHDQVLEAMPRIVEMVPDLEWHIAGEGSYLEEFRQRASASPCAERIHVHGFLPDPDLQLLYRTCRVLAMPSSGEGFGIVYLEAMQHGCVPIGSTTDAASEVIGDGGVCVDLDDRVGLERLLCLLLTEPDEHYEKRSQRARERARDFSQGRFQENLLGALARVGGGT